MLVILEQENAWKDVYTVFRSKPKSFRDVIRELKSKYPDTHANFWNDLENLVTKEDLSLSQYRMVLKDMLRIERNALVEDFALETRRVTERAESVAEWRDEMLGVIEDNYKKLYVSGSGGGVDEKMIREQVQSQLVFLGAFGVVLGLELLKGEIPKQLLYRAELYGKRGTALYEMGRLHDVGMDDLVYWKLGVAEHCPDCIDRANASPFLRRNLPSFPADGSTMCKTNCKCRLVLAGEEFL